MDPEYRSARIDCAERYLKEVRSMAARHRANDEYIRSLYADAEGVGGIDYSRALASTSPDLDRLPDSVQALIEMKREAEADAAEYFARKREARGLLDEMGGTHGLLLMLYYVVALPWKAVADALNYSEAWCRHMRPDALCEFYDFLPHTYRMPQQPAV